MFLIDDELIAGIGLGVLVTIFGPKIVKPVEKYLHPIFKVPIKGAILLRNEAVKAGKSIGGWAGGLWKESEEELKEGDKKVSRG